MTDITELAHREKFEAWWERTQHSGNPPRFGWSHWRDGEGYKVDDDNSELDGMWSAWKAAGAELVEALEKAQQQITHLEYRAVTVKLPKRHSMLLREDFNEDYHTEMAFKADEVQASLSAAGIKVEAE
ncbi:hypothetical protein [Klebsiella pneumoniae]|uniref:hypothetical protein n=1 Tax=Klebsiella pneumoniae TaxID=573 RepID=UPI000CEBB098|nr:hypothetical protein [Klebsiella pneumoniae]MBD7567506.1 hypothetical protein [Klebsiella pneumoniae]PUH12830.1 hypothetical protein DB350_00235 [Klebsiella pneumoniae]ROE54835.1 hypothetical protein C4Y92_001570 [Klebsiella pneumoniae subsp. pneumoniae]SXZ59163.1 Uncharacterised protein [Klebsiella pneumoniae]HBU2186051.1 hypothetical protein [Klebsiella pneumoniae]